MYGFSSATEPALGATAVAAFLLNVDIFDVVDHNWCRQPVWNATSNLQLNHVLYIKGILACRNQSCRK